MIDQDGTLTARQQEIKERLDRAMSAQEIASELGITRNAVYQQIQSLRRKGKLAPNFTPSGAPRRELVAAHGIEPLAIQQTRLLADVAARLRALADDIDAQVGS